jgi:hypothetical protein
MRNFILGLILGSLLTGTIVGAGNFYDSSGKPNAPSGSVQQFDYFRQRQQFLDLNAMRRNSDEARLADPCRR